MNNKDLSKNGIPSGQEELGQKRAFNLGKALSSGLKGAVAAQIMTACSPMMPSTMDTTTLTHPSITNSLSSS